MFYSPLGKQNRTFIWTFFSGKTALAARERGWAASIARYPCTAFSDRAGMESENAFLVLGRFFGLSIFRARCKVD